MKLSRNSFFGDDSSDWLWDVDIAESTDEFEYPLLICDTSNIDEKLIEWDPASKNHDYFNLTKDFPYDERYNRFNLENAQSELLESKLISSFRAKKWRSVIASSSKFEPEHSNQNAFASEDSVISDFNSRGGGLEATRFSYRLILVDVGVGNLEDALCLSIAIHQLDKHFLLWKLFKFTLIQILLDVRLYPLEIKTLISGLGPPVGILVWPPRWLSTLQAHRGNRPFDLLNSDWFASFFGLLPSI